MTDNEIRTAFEEHKDAVYRVAWRLTNSTAGAEDVTQEVFLSLMRVRDRYDPNRGRLRSFLLGITRNVVLKRWREENRWEELADEQFLEAPAPLVNTDISNMVAEAVHMLPLLQREVLILAEYEELSLEEIARAVDAEVGTVGSFGDRPQSKEFRSPNLALFDDVSLFE